jgi:nucleolar GTP-binding protein
VSTSISLDDRDVIEAGALTMSVTERENVDAVLDAAVEAVDYEPELPIDENR